MPALLEAQSTLTSRYQTTVPEPVRRALRLSKNDKLHYSLHSDGQIVIKRAITQPESDPVLEAFLSFLARDITEHPQHLKSSSAEQRRSIRQLTRGVKFNLSEALPSEGE